MWKKDKKVGETDMNYDDVSHDVNTQNDATIWSRRYISKASFVGIWLPICQMLGGVTWRTVRGLHAYLVGRIESLKSFECPAPEWAATKTLAI